VTAVRIVVGLLGVAVVIATFLSAVKTVVLPRGFPTRLGRLVFRGLAAVFLLRARPSHSYERRDRVLAMYAPIGLLSLLAAWMFLALCGYAALYWALGDISVGDAFSESGSSLLTLGFLEPSSGVGVALAISEALLGLVLLAMLITYLPSIYGAFSRREAQVTALDIRAGSPPSGVRLVEFFGIMGQIENLGDFWSTWERWFVEIEETHTSFPAVVFFRSPQSDHSWVVAAGAVLDGASLLASCVDVPREPRAEFAIRAGYLALRRVADYFGIPLPVDPHFPDQPISVTREEFDEVWERLATGGVPMKPDREQAWLDFGGWRVNYDVPLVALAGLTVAPVASWSSDRGIVAVRPPIFRRRVRPVSPR
jgi:hypothetical protein